MSYEIIYQAHAFRVPARDTGLADDRFVVAVEMGSNNCYDARGKRSRRWRTLCIGTHEAVMAQARALSSDCPGGMLQSRRGGWSADGFVAYVARLVKRAGIEGQPAPGRKHPWRWEGGGWRQELVLDPTHPLVAALDARGIAMRASGWNGTQRTPEPLPVGEYFTLIEPFVGYEGCRERTHRIAPVDCAGIIGLPTS